MVKTGIFLPNGSNGYIISEGAPIYRPSFEHNKAIAIEAERAGIDMVLSMMKYRGFEGKTGFWDYCLESFTLMAGLAAATERIELFPTVTLPVHNPAIAARFVSTIDDISNGRCGLNIVTGWNKDEYAQMGLWPGDQYYTTRYEFAGEYVQLLRSLWDDGIVTAKTDHFDLVECHALPQPKHRPTIVSAGQSAAGARFVAQFADRNFVQAGPKKLKPIVDRVKQAGREFGRDVGTYAVFQIIASERSEDAQLHKQTILERADTGAINNFVASALLDKNPEGISQHQATGMSREPEEGNSAFMTIPVIAGSFEEVAAQLDRIIDDSGVEGVLFSFPNFIEGIRNFGDHVRPLMTTL